MQGWRRLGEYLGAIYWALGADHPPLGEDETVVLRGYAIVLLGRWRGFDGGEATLTDRRFIFRPVGRRRVPNGVLRMLNLPREGFELADVERVTVSPRDGPRTWRVVEVALRSGRTYRFRPGDGDRWASELRRLTVNPPVDDPTAPGGDGGGKTDGRART